MKDVNRYTFVYNWQYLLSAMYNYDAHSTTHYNNNETQIRFYPPMNNRWMKVLFPFLALAAGFGGMTLIEVSASEDEQKDIVDTRPTVTN